MAQIIDPWSGFNQGIQNLNQSLSDIRRQKVEDLELESRGLQNKAAAAQLQETLLRQQQNQELRNALAAKPETVTDTQFVPSQVSPSIDMLNRMPGQQTTTPLMPAPVQNPSVFNTPGEIKTSKYLQQVDPAMVAYSTLMSQGRFQEADSALNLAKNNAQLKGEMDAVGSTDLADYFTKQAKLAMTKTQSDMLDKGFTAIANLMDKGGISAVAQFQGQIKQIPGFENFDSSKMIADNTNRFMSYDAGNGFSVIVDKEHPKEFKIEPMTDISLFLKAYMQEHPQATMADVQKAYRADQLEKFKAQRTVIGSTKVIIPSFQQARDLPPGVVFNRRDGKYTWQNGTPLTAAEMKNMALDYKQEKGEAAQRASSRAMNVDSAYKMFSQEAPEIIALRNKVQAKGLLPGNITDVNKLNQWIGKKVSDPDVVLLQKKTKFLADSLQRTIGGTQGGQWAFEVAADILNPTYSPEAFAGIVNSHKQAMGRMRDAIRSFGEEPGGNPSIDTSRPVHNGKLQGYKQADGSIVDANGKRLN